MLTALTLPRLLDRTPDRVVMLTSAALMIASLCALAAFIPSVGLSWPLLLGAWVTVGIGYSGILTPSGRLLRRSSHPEDRPALFAAQFALSHACWLVTYPLSGWLMTAYGALAALAGLSALAFFGAVLALLLWPSSDPVVIAHRHDDLPPHHPHLRDTREHAHPYMIDDLHRRWPPANSRSPD